MQDFDVQYQKLNDAQKRAVDTIEGPVIVVAGPGTGKTQILTLRIANILRSAGAGIGPENILALTFTNAGVIAMRERLSLFIGAESAYRTNIFTFHSFCEEQIGRYPDYFPLITYARVATEIEKIHIIEKILHEEELQLLKTFGSDHHYIKDIIYAIDQLKREGVSPDIFVARIAMQEKEILADPNSYYKRTTKKNKKDDLKSGVLKPIEKNRELQRVYDIYQQVLREKKLYDFTDMIMQFVEIAEKDEELTSILCEQYQYILVDEHQDTNDGQNRIIAVLTHAEHLGDYPNLFTVGDDKQAIYRFQGASVDNFLHFEKRFSRAVIIHLEENYRSAQGILDEAHTLISGGLHGNLHKELVATTDDHADIRVLRYGEYRDELISIADDIHKKILSGVLPKDIAIFYREHNNLKYIKEVLEKMHVPYVIVSKQNALDNVEIQKLILFLQVINDPMDDHVLGKALLMNLSQVDVDDALLILEYYNRCVYNMSLYHCLSQEKVLQEAGVKNIIAISTFAQLIKDQKINAHNMYFVEFFENFVRESGFLKHVMSCSDHIFLLKNLERIFDEVRECVIEKKQYDLGDFIMYINSFDEYNLSLSVVRPSVMNGVQLMTAHGSKGLEYEHVYVTNAIHGLWGGKRKSQKFVLPINTVSGDMEDERRLFYVAITRAKRSLTISYADYDKDGREKLPSLFIADLKACLIDMKNVKMHGSEDVFFMPRMQSVTSLVSLDYIRDKFLRTQLSATALNNYFESPLLYFFRNLVRIPSAPNKTMFYGTVLHSALERFFTLSQKEGHVLSQEDLIDFFYRAMLVMRTPREYYDSIKKRGEKALKGYYEKYSSELSYQVVVEKKISGIPFTLNSGEKILLTGKIDKMEFTDEKTVIVVDYKTGKPWSKYTKEKKESLKRQVVFYKLLLNEYNEHQFNMTQGILDFIEPHPMTHEYEKQVIAVTDSDVEELKKEINIFAQDILSGAFLDKSITEKFNDKSLSEYVTFLELLKN